MLISFSQKQSKYFLMVITLFAIVLADQNVRFLNWYGVVEVFSISVVWERGVWTLSDEKASV